MHPVSTRFSPLTRAASLPLHYLYRCCSKQACCTNQGQLHSLASSHGTHKSDSEALSLTCLSDMLCHAADYDLTGQTIWPAAQMLADYLADNIERLQNCSCACELGAGLGLVGLFAAQACPVIMTDHNEVVLRVMNKNAVLNQAHHSIRSAAIDSYTNRCNPSAHDV